MYQDYKNGGMKMNNYNISIKPQRIGWLKRLLYGEKHMGWKMYFDYCCRLVGGRFIFLCDYEVSKMKLKIPPYYLEVLKAWEEIRECREIEGERRNPIIFNNRDICIKGKMIFDVDLFKKETYLVSHFLEKGRVKSFNYFINRGMKSKDLLLITDICNAIPEILKDESRWDTFQHVDIATFDIVLKVLGQKRLFKDTHSRTFYDFFIKDLQKLYCMEIKDDQKSYDYNDKEVSEIFNRPRHTTILNKHREFQYKLLHGVIYTKVQLLKFGFVWDNLCSFCKNEVETYAHVFWTVLMLEMYGKE